MNYMQMYDISDDSWTVVDKKFANRAYHNIHYNQGKIYILGGKRLAKNPKLEYLNDQVEVYDLSVDTVYSSYGYPHQSINFASGVYDNQVFVMNGSVKQYYSREKVYGSKKDYSNQCHVLELNSGMWYELDTLPDADESVGVVIDTILYKISSHMYWKNSSINSLNLETGEYALEVELPNNLYLQKPAIACNKEQGVIYLFEYDKFITYDVYKKVAKIYKIDLELIYSGMVYSDGFVYIMGGKKDDAKILPSNYVFRVDIGELSKTMFRTLAEYQEKGI